LSPNFRAELLRFPASRRGDQGDAIGLIGQLLDTTVRPAPLKPVVRPRRDWWDREEKRGAVNWKTVRVGGGRRRGRRSGRVPMSVVPAVVSRDADDEVTECIKFQLH
jgi:hypothetical protein